MIHAKAVTISEPGGPEVLHIKPHSVRKPGGSEILVEVAAAGLNRADTLQRRGLYPAPTNAPAQIPGLEYAGLVRQVGPAVQRWSIGDRVMGIVPGGGMSTHLITHEREALPIPANMDLTTAAAIPETFLTAFDALYLQAKLAMGERLLIHAVGSGIGTSALQLALAMNAEVTGTSRTASKIERCQDLGLVQGIHVTDGRFADNLNVHVILDLVGASYVQENLRALAPRGRIVTIGLMGGARSEIPLNILLQKRVSWMGSVLRSRSLEEKATLMRAFEIHVLPLLATKQIRPVIDAVIPMSNIREAHSSMDGNNTFGKLVLTW